ncbi:MAG TPA: hypothetical protein VKR60_14770 [Candidatus Sulfotelmatobacter sp.]|nr:hypothetical protein [Candidatus Sulfotelmatobacter sp.]
MTSSRVAELRREDIAAAAKTFRSTRQMTKWSVVVEGRELPARPLVLEAAGVPPNDPTNSHQAVALLKSRGFEVRYQGKTIQQEDAKQAMSPGIDDLIRKLRGRYAGTHSLLEDREREHRIEKDRLAR